jgi:hypothetical protein
VGYKVLDTVVLAADLPEHGLKAGDLGAVVEIYSDKAVEVEFVAGSGRTQALLTLSLEQVRPIAPNDMPSVRPANDVSAA